ncbi:MAG: T9SS type A sorting domain-containing protein [Bacteroidales bacterium]
MKDLIISPNPSGGFVSLSLSNCLEQDFTAYIFTPTGSLVFESSLSFYNRDNIRQLNLHSLLDGVYFVFLRGKVDFFTHKIIITHNRKDHVL